MVTVTTSAGETCQAAVAVGSCSITSTTPGTRSITATYSGDTDFIGSFSLAVPHTVVISVAGNIKQYIAFGSNTNLGGVTVTLTGSENRQATTDANGNYTFGILTNGGSYEITPAGLGKTYEPISRSYANVTTNILNPNFIAYDVPGPNANPRSTRIVNTVATAGQPVSVPFIMSTALGNETKVSFTAHYVVGVLGVPTVTCGSHVPGCTVAVNNSIPGKVGVTITPVGAITPGLRQVALMTFPTSPSAVASTPILFGDFPTTRLVTDAGNHPLPVLYWTNGVVAFNPTTLLEGATLTGRVMTSSGQGIRNANVVLIDQQGNRRTAITTSFGTYAFEGLELGANYTISVSSRRFRFASRVISVTDNLAGVDFVGLE